MVMNLKNIYKYLPQGWKNESIEINWGFKEFTKYDYEFLPQGLIEKLMIYFHFVSFFDAVRN